MEPKTKAGMAPTKLQPGLELRQSLGTVSFIKTKQCTSQNATAAALQTASVTEKVEYIDTT